MGDKTQLATIALASESFSPFVTLSGTILGMFFTSIIGIFIGYKFGKNIPEFTIKIASASIFILFGFIKFFRFINREFLFLIGSPLTITVLVLYSILLMKAFRNRDAITEYKKIAEELKVLQEDINQQVEVTCLTEEHCGKCEGNKCLIGQIKNIIESGETIGLENEFKNKFSHKQLILIQEKIITFLSLIKDEKTFEIYNNVRMKIELELFKEIFDFENKEEYIKLLKKNKTKNAKLLLKKITSNSKE